MELLQKQPTEFYINKKVEELKQNLKLITSNKIRLENDLRNSMDHFKDHCLKIRGDIDLATEAVQKQFKSLKKAVQVIQEQKVKLIKQVDEYEKCILHFQCIRYCKDS